MVILVGCESKQPAQTPAKSPAPIDILDLTEASGPTLIVHYHDGVFDFIDHEGLVVLTSKDLDDFKVAIESQLIQDLIVDERAIFRFKGDTPPGGIFRPKRLNRRLRRSTTLAPPRKNSTTRIRNLNSSVRNKHDTNNTVRGRDQELTKIEHDLTDGRSTRQSVPASLVVK